MRKTSTFIALVLAAFGAAAQTKPVPELANRQDALPSCYKHTGVEPPTQTASRGYFLLIDQTTDLDAALRETIRAQTRANLQPGTQFAVATFSAFLDDRYTDIVMGGRTEALLSQAARNATGKTKLKALDRCLVRQLDYAKALATVEIDKAFGAASTTIARSDVLASLADFARHVVAPSTAQTKILVIASDMLENSSIASFYANRAVKRLDPAAELRRVREHGLLPDLSGVRVYVIGAGLLNTKGATVQSGSYRDPQTMLALEKFWADYFKAANADLIEFGKPQLLRAVE